MMRSLNVVLFAAALAMARPVRAQLYPRHAPPGAAQYDIRYDPVSRTVIAYDRQGREIFRHRAVRASGSMRPRWAYRRGPASTYGRPVVYAPRFGSECRRIANPVSRRSCECSVAYGGVARALPNGRVGWSDPKGGGGNLALQRCKGGA
ncbi:hypothetical protein [Rhabdaerophilum calidifontis]|uniref:hypothetical protein n=1 Tax=Rhabdaerophilum calidifontis TaxID=2604328 RepID=UPI00123B4B92|nr:hypothetical protein [Rhabdaerophilum calidifontis]